MFSIYSSLSFFFSLVGGPTVWPGDHWSRSSCPEGGEDDKCGLCRIYRATTSEAVNTPSGRGSHCNCTGSRFGAKQEGDPRPSYMAAILRSEHSSDCLTTAQSGTGLQSLMAKASRRPTAGHPGLSMTSLFTKKWQARLPSHGPR